MNCSNKLLHSLELLLNLLCPAAHRACILCSGLRSAGLALSDATEGALKRTEEPTHAGPFLRDAELQLLGACTANLAPISGPDSFRGLTQ